MAYCSLLSSYNNPMKVGTIISILEKRKLRLIEDK